MRKSRRRRCIPRDDGPPSLPPPQKKNSKKFVWRTTQANDYKWCSLDNNIFLSILSTGVVQVSYRCHTGVETEVSWVGVLWGEEKKWYKLRTDQVWLDVDWRSGQGQVLVTLCWMDPKLQGRGLVRKKNWGMNEWMNELIIILLMN